MIQFFDAPQVVNIICMGWLGVAGSVLAILGVVAAPITTGDTCFRSVRLIFAETFHVSQQKVSRRLLISLPIFGVALLMLIWQITSPDGFRTVWQYMGWGTQFLAAVSLWICTVYLARKQKFYWMTLVPAVFMTVVCTAFILVSPIAFGLPKLLSYVVTAVFTLSLIAAFVYWKRKQ